ncbi:hypothetical protein B566_EDAN002295, partial [Ephemera danica]
MKFLSSRVQSRVRRGWYQQRQAEDSQSASSISCIVTLRWAAAAVVVGLACGVRVCCQSHISKGHLIYVSKSVSIEAGMEAAEDVTSSVAEQLVHNGADNDKQKADALTESPCTEQTKCHIWSPLHPSAWFNPDRLPPA